MSGCTKKYTDPSSLRKHVKNHTYDEQIQLKNKSVEKSQEEVHFMTNRRLTIKSNRNNNNNTNSNTSTQKIANNFHPNIDHNYSNNLSNLRQEIKNKLSEKLSKDKRTTKSG